MYSRESKHVFQSIGEYPTVVFFTPENPLGGGIEVGIDIPGAFGFINELGPAGGNLYSKIESLRTINIM